MVKRIIIVEDDSSIQDAVRLILEAEGFVVESLHNGDALLKLHFAPPALFILDKQLTGVDGLEVCSFLKSQPMTRHIPVIMLSANPNIIKLAGAAGADGALEKPFQMKALIAVVEKLVKASVEF